jgi:hypothetical protein
LKDKIVKTISIANKFNTKIHFFKSTAIHYDKSFPRKAKMGTCPTLNE